MKERTIIFGNLYDIIPKIHEKLGDKCPSDDVLKDILIVYTEDLFGRMNKAMTLRYLDDAKKYNESLPTSQEIFDNNIND